MAAKAIADIDEAPAINSAPMLFSILDEALEQL